MHAEGGGGGGSGGGGGGICKGPFRHYRKRRVSAVIIGSSAYNITAQPFERAKRLQAHLDGSILVVCKEASFERRAFRPALRNAPSPPAFPHHKDRENANISELSSFE